MTTAPTANPTATRGSLLAALWTLYKLTLRQHQHGKRWIIIVLLMLLPAGLGLLLHTIARDVPAIALEFICVFLLIPQALLPLTTLIYASGIIQDEQEEQTITYLLVRPIPKGALYVVKLLATMTTTVVLTVLLTIFTYAAIYARADAGSENVVLRCAQACAIHSLATIAYCCLFGLISVWTRWTLIVGVLYIVLFEGLFANLAFGIRLITVIYHTRIIAYRTMSFLVPTPEGPADIASFMWKLDMQNDPKLLDHPQLSTCLTVLIAGGLVCTILAAWLCSQREFHVKTPEKG